MSDAFVKPEGLFDAPCRGKNNRSVALSQTVGTYPIDAAFENENASQAVGRWERALNVAIWQALLMSAQPSRVLLSLPGSSLTSRGTR